jgi:hypothetical protein
MLIAAVLAVNPVRINAMVVVWVVVQVIAPLRLHHTMYISRVLTDLYKLELK